MLLVVVVVKLRHSLEGENDKSHFRVLEASVTIVADFPWRSKHQTTRHNCDGNHHRGPAMAMLCLGHSWKREV